MGIVKGKVITGAVGPVTFSSWRDIQVVKQRVFEVRQSNATKNVSTVFGLGSRFSAILRRRMYPIHFIHDGALVNRMNKAMTAILLKHRDKVTGNFDFPEDSFKPMNGFELNESSPLKENLHVMPQVNLKDGKLTVNIPEFDIKKALKFPTEADSCTIIVSVYIASLKTKDHCRMNTEMTKTFAVDWSDKTSTAMEWPYDVPEGCYCVTSMALHFHKQWSNLQVSLNSKSFCPAMICDFSINPGVFKDKPKDWLKTSFAFVDDEYPLIRKKTKTKNTVVNKKTKDSPVKAEKKKSAKKSSREEKEDKNGLEQLQLQQQENETLKSELHELKARMAALEQLLTANTAIQEKENQHQKEEIIADKKPIVLSDKKLSAASDQEPTFWKDALKKVLTGNHSPSILATHPKTRGKPAA
ncbi:hypothetical protein PBAL39_16941 [Pedobacter sp. BAL39]|uniref:hypothetical protein n=1 Tax=Pedobacter sp. BAL39 TaxID=391596 RepID=UPI0001559466|nr:hypothetical protein [Pedobacter sp. BAL39]EDM35188.1 hypothetical protein PBAL39_16941 [Pedobacter sp. BAL39]